MRRLLEANGGDHNLGYRRFLVAIPVKSDQVTGVMLLSPPSRYGWLELKATARFVFTLCRHIGLTKVICVIGTCAIFRIPADQRTQ